MPPITSFKSVNTLKIGKKPAFANELIINPAFIVHFLSTITTISISQGRELLNLVKIYTNEVKYSSQNNSFIFKLAIFYDIYARAIVLLKAKMKAFSIILKKLVLDYYYSNISISSIGLNRRIKLIMLGNQVDERDEKD